MAKRLLSGGEAIAHAALAAGASVIAGYPTDSLSQLIESALRQITKRSATGSYAQWTVNDKTTLGICAATSLSGLRSLAAFGQTGFSEVIQGITALSHAGLQGGLVVVVADEPASDAFSTNLDVRRICELANIPVIDPETSELAYSSVSAAFILSESYSTPVVIHISADINYSSTFFDIETHTKAAMRKGTFLKNRETLDVSDLLVEDSQDYADMSGNNLSDMDVRLKEIAYKFAYKDIFATYNKIFDFEQQYEGKHNNKRLQQKKSDDVPDFEGATPLPSSRITPLDESNIKIGICVCGSAAPYALEAIETLRKEAHKSKVSTPFIRLFMLGTPFPVPKRTLRKFLDGLNEILVIEEFSSFAEEELIKQSATSFLGPNVHGRFTDEVNYNYPINFETTILHIAAFIDKCINMKSEKNVVDSAAETALLPVINLGKHSSPPDNSKNLTPKQSRTLTGIARRLASPESIYSYNSEIPDRPPVLCSGCPHRASFYAIERALDRLKIPRKNVVVSGDIGCSLLGNNPPLDFLDAYLGEGFSTSLAQGFSLGMPDSDGNAKSIAVLGDSSLFANAIPSITNAVVNNMDMTIVVLDNKTCAESGLQPTPTTYGTVDIAEVLHSLGIQNVREADPFEFSNAMDSCVKAIRDIRPSAVVLSSKCARLVRNGKVTFVNTNKCTGCKDCITKLGCPAISFDKDIIGKKSGTLGQAVIDINQCNGCRLCVHICPSEAIRVMMHKDVVELLRQERRKNAKVSDERAFIPDDETMEDESESAADTHEAEEQKEELLNLFTSGPLVVLDDEPEEPTKDAANEEEASSKKATPHKPAKQYARADFGTLFGGKNAELRLNFDDDDDDVEEELETDLVDQDEFEDDVIEETEDNGVDNASDDDYTEIEDALDDEVPENELLDEETIEADDRAVDEVEDEDDSEIEVDDDEVYKELEDEGLDDDEELDDELDDSDSEDDGDVK